MPQYPAVISVSTLDGSNGFRIDGAAAGDYTGRAVAGAGDVNGDGFSDLIIGAPNADVAAWPGSGVAYVVFGKASGFGPTLELSSLDGSNGFRLSGGQGSGWLGSSVASAGDVNGDGVADVVVGAPVFRYGASYIV